MKNAIRAIAASSAVVLATTARAADAIDTAPVTSALTAAGAACAVVGGASLAVYVGVRAFKMIRTAL